jgi:ribonucleotide reductase alpha subunit
MKQVEADDDWYFMCPDKCPGLTDAYGEKYEKLYWSYVEQNKYNKKVKARDVMKAILDSQLETGTPYITFKDNVNKKSNQKNIGTIKSSNLCVDGETLLLTKNGHKTIKYLKDQEVDIWNGFEWSKVTVKQTGINCLIIKVIVKPFKNNKELPYRVLKCTPYHKFYINDDKENTVNACNLQLGFKLIGYDDSNLSSLTLNNYDYAEVISIENLGLKGDTYCVSEPLRHMAVFNGILTGQCNEIVEYSDANEYAVCNLASIAINKCVNQFVFDKDDEWTIYTKENCKYCKWAKTFLSNKGIQFLEIKNTLPQIKDVNTYPQIFHGNNHIGGFDKLYEYTKGTFDFNKLYDIAYVATINLNKIIDLNYYPVIEAKRSNLKHRPIGLGIQGLADALVLMKIPFDSEESVQFNSQMMETIYLAAITASNDISKERYNLLKDVIINNKDNLPEYYDNTLVLENDQVNNVYHQLKLNKFELENKIFDKTIGSYSTFSGSPISEGQFQFDLWDFDRNNLMHKDKWLHLTNEVKTYGVRNSLVTALMPTASTSQILGNNECFEFFTNNIYSRRTLAGDFPLVNKYLIDDLYNLGLWSNDMKQLILANNGSISNFNNIPEQIRNLYKTIWEIKQIWVLKNAIARGPFNDQTQSMNIFMQVPDYQRLYSSHFYAWKNGLKTGIYYLRTKPAKEAVKVTIDPNIHKKLEEITSNDEVCEFCSA